LAIKGKILLEELFQLIISNLNDIRNKLWDIQKNIEEDVRLAQKKEELEEETRKDSLT